jgi:hypothetical protein
VGRVGEEQIKLNTLFKLNSQQDKSFTATYYIIECNVSHFDYFALGLRSILRNHTEHNDIQHYDTQHNDTQH